MVESLKTEKRDYVPGNFETVSIPESYGIIWTAITEKGHEYVNGFEDVLAGERFGDGMQSNNPGGVFQLAFALAIAKNAKIAEIATIGAQLSSSEVVGELRKIHALSGMKIIDLGCGRAYFARVAAALGAEVYTADSKDLSPGIRANIKGHVRIDLNKPDALTVLKHGTGGDFDLVTEWIMAPMGSDDYRLEAPKKETILRLGEGLLKKGGYLFQELVRSKPLRKR